MKRKRERRPFNKTRLKNQILNVVKNPFNMIVAISLVILFCLIEMIIRRPVPEKLQEYAMRAGVAFLICLMLFATFNDVKRWFVRPDAVKTEIVQDKE